ncbi:hypothetical protein M0R04_08375 [Candidatus Dojkabacteria bacterium]|jgi:hypothetical protein|nr:hypothetical protein [Candidatus Dojkabacteria bacterium]
MDYRDIASTQATITSYLDAFNKLRKYCEKLECDSQEFNHRTVLPTHWRPSLGQSNESFRKDANFLSATHASLLDFGKARYLAKGYWDYDSFFKVSWQIQFPFDIFAWEIGRESYINTKGKTIPAVPTVMTAWSKENICLGEISSWSMKSWALPDWWSKHIEIESFMDDNPTLKDKYREEVKKADKEVNDWQKALEAQVNLMNIFENSQSK